MLGGVYTQPADLKGDNCKVSDPPIIEALVERKIFLDTALKSLPPQKKTNVAISRALCSPSLLWIYIYISIHILLIEPLAHNPNFTKPLEFLSILASPGPSPPSRRVCLHHLELMNGSCRQTPFFPGTDVGWFQVVHP